MRSPRSRLLAIPLVWLPALTALWLYAATRDWSHTWRQLQMGHPVSWPRPKHGPTPRAVQDTERIAAVALRIAEVGLAGCLVLVLLIAANRLRHRRRRVRAMDRWELRLGRDDLANPYHVQEAFEGIAGAIGVRWYERLWRGPEHLALEIHRLPDDSIRFVLAAPRYLEPAISGPLEDLYPDVELQAADGAPDWARHRGSPQEARLVRAVDPDDTQLRARLLRDARRADGEERGGAVGAAGARARARVRAPARPGAAQAPRARPAARRPPRPRRTRHRLDRRGQGTQGRPRTAAPHPLPLRPARRRRRPRRRCARVAGLFCQLRSENELIRREMRVRRKIYARRIAAAMPNPLPALRTGVLSTSELATVWQLPRGRVKHGGLAALVGAARKRTGRHRPRRRARPHAGRARPGHDRRRATASTATRSSAAKAAARAR